MTTLAGRVAVVTGAAGGLGREICDVLGAAGAVVVAVDLDGEGCLHLDIGTDAGNEAMVDAAISQHGRLDVLVLNAGVQHRAPIARFPESEWDRLFDVMVKGPFLAMKHAWPHLTASPGGRVVVTASGSSFVGEREKAAYVAAKHAVAGLVKVAAIEGAPFGLTVTGVAPGWMLTPLVERQLQERENSGEGSREEIIGRLLHDHPVPRFVQPREVADVIAFLAGPLSGGITGSCIPVDLGALA